MSGWSLRLTGGGQGIAEKFWINLFQYGGAVLEPAGRRQVERQLRQRGGPRGAEAVSGERARLKTRHARDAGRRRSLRARADRDVHPRILGDRRHRPKAPDLNYATAPLPRGSIALPTNLYVTAEGDEAKAAWDFVMATNEPENLMWLLDNVGWLPNRAESTIPAC